HVSCREPGRPRTWCPEGDGRFTLADLFVIRMLLSRSVSISCLPCFGNEAGRSASPWVPGDVAPLTGRDGRVDVGDVVVALRTAVGLVTLSSDAASRADVAPLSAPGTAGGDGHVDVTDVVVLLRLSVGLDALAWPERR